MPELVLYNFIKRRNSTKVPDNDSGTRVTVSLKDNCSMYEPRLELQTSLIGFEPMRYTYAQFMGRYYFVTDTVWERGVWTYFLSEDVLGTFKATIGRTTAYVLRCATFHDPTITDVLYPATTDIDTKRTEFTLEDGWITNPTVANGYYVVGIVNNLSTTYGAVTHYVMTGQEMAAFRAYMLGSIQSWDEITDFSGDVAKAFIDPFQYVVSCMWFPTGVPVEATKTKIAFGYWTSELEASLLSQTTRNYPFSLARPDRSTNADLDYLYRAPWANYYLYLQPWGSLQLDASKMGKTGVSCNITYDFVSGKAILTVKSKLTNDVLYNGEAQVGVAMQLSNVGFDYKGATSGMSSLVETAKNAVGGLVGNIGQKFNASNIVSSAIASNASVQSTGSNSGMGADALGGKATLYANYFRPVMFDLADNGRPLCQLKKISDCSGYVKVENGNIDTNGTEREKMMIKEFLEGGFYYE